MTLEDLYRLLCSGHVQTQGIVDTIRTPLVVLDGQFRIDGGNQAFFDSFGLQREAAMGRSLFEIGDKQFDVPELRVLLDDIIPKSSAIVGYELKMELQGKGRRTLCLNVRRMAHPDNNSQNMLVEIEDTTDSQRAAASKDILLEETRHRMRNLLAVVRSLANQTRVENRSAADYRTAFLGRLETVLHAQELGHPLSTDLETLVRQAVDGEARLKLQPGPKVALRQNQVLPLKMILHELATNAVKYGALSAQHGVVHVGWQVRDGIDGHGDGKGNGHDRSARTLHFDWREEGGPAVSRPAHRGFGTRLIEFSAGGDLGGKAEIEFDPQGLRARIEATLN